MARVFARWTNATIRSAPSGKAVRRPALLPCGVSRFYFETDAAEPCPIAFGGADDVLVYFISLAFSTRYGSLHPLSQLALLLRGEMKINLTPLTTFVLHGEAARDRFAFSRGRNTDSVRAQSGVRKVLP